MELASSGVDPLVLRVAAGTQEVGAAVVPGLLARAERPTAVLCVSDAVAAGVMRAAQDAGLRVPEACRSSDSTTSRWPGACARR